MLEYLLTFVKSFWVCYFPDTMLMSVGPITETTNLEHFSNKYLAKAESAPGVKYYKSSPISRCKVRREIENNASEANI